MRRAGEYVDNVLAQAMGRLVTAAATLGVSALVARLLGVAAYGRFAYVMVFLAVAVGLAEFGTNSILARDLANAGDGSAPYWGNFLAVRLGLSVLVAMLAIPVAYIANRELWVLLLPGILALPFLASRFFEPVFQAYRRPWYSTWSSSLYGGLLLLATLLVLLAHGELLSVVVAYLLCNVVYVLAALYLAGKLLQPRFNLSWEAARGLLVSAAPVGLGSIISVVNARGDVFLLNHMRSGYEVGLYNAAYRVLEVAGAVAIVLMNPAIQIFSAEGASDRVRLRAIFGRILEGLAILTIPVAILTPHLSRPLITAVFGAQFLPSAPVLDVLAWVGVLVFFFLFGYALCVAIHAVRLGAVLITVVAALNLGLNYLWIPSDGYMGTAWARLTSDLVLTGGTLGYVLFLVGNVFSPAAWLRILGLAGALWLFLRVSAAAGPAALVLGGLLYAAAVAGLRMFPTELLSLGRRS